MRFLSIETENFRMLRNLKFNFSVDPEKPLTVIRAENETGKTTLWRAIAWILHGEQYLKKLSDYQLTPKSWVTEALGETCQIRVNLEFIAPKKSNLSSDTDVRYRLVRTVKERYLENESKFTPIDSSKTELFICTESGLTPVTPEAKANNLIRHYFPMELIDLFLLNGNTMEDQMFSKSESQRESRSTVEDFLRKAMDIKIYEKSQEHSNRIRKKKLQSLGDNSGSDGTLANNVATLLGKVEELDDIKIPASKEKIRNQTIEIQKKTLEIDNAQSEGNREDIETERDRLKVNQESERKKEMKHLGSLSANLTSEYFAIDCLSELVLKPFKNRIDGLKEEGIIPRQTVPFLERIIEKGDKCICGEKLTEQNADGIERKKHIMHLIEKSKDQDKTSDLITSLDYQCISMNIWKEDNINKWLNTQENYNADLLVSIDQQGIIGAEISEKNDILDALSAKDVKALRVEREAIKVSMSNENSTLESLRMASTNLNRDLQDAEDKLEKFRIKEAQNTSLNSQIDLIQDAERIFEELLDVLQNKKSKAVSEEMNKRFLEMTGAKDKHIGPIKEVKITEEKDVKVTTKEDIKFTPRDNLNGASLRALTLSFVLALCKESGKSLPHVIDTPFGMTSGIRSDMLETAVKNSEQIILCVTPSEIRGLEKVFMQYTDPTYSYSLSFSEHYPTYLKNNSSQISETVRCECSFLEWCNVCERIEWDEKTVFDKELYMELQNEYL